MTNLELRRAARTAMRLLHRLEKWTSDDNVQVIAKLALIEVAKLQCSLPVPIKCEWDCKNSKKNLQHCCTDKKGHF